MKKYLRFILLLLASVTANAQKPNVVFILVDDMGYGDLDVMGKN